MFFMRIGANLRAVALLGITDAEIESFYRVLETIMTNLAAASSK